MLRRLTIIGLAAALAAPGAIATAGAGEECVVTPSGLECHVAGTSTSVASGWEPTPGAPLRYLRVSGGCWAWSTSPPGLDADDHDNEARIIRTISTLPECEPEAVEGGGGDIGTSMVTSRAWEVFRDFPLDRPRIRLEPAGGGITGLATHASAPIPLRIRHTERLPDGTTLQVEATVRSILMDWGDGTPPETYSPGEFRPRPTGSAAHVYALKTCSAGYRSSHPSGPNCHPALEAYPVRAAFVWHARFRRGGPWTDLGDLERWSEVPYDVDEVVGVLG